MQNTQITNFQDDVLIVHFNTSGTAVFTDMPLLRYSHTYTFGHGLSVYSYGQQTIVFYNDSKDNMERDLDKKPDRNTSYRHSIFAAYVASADGKAQRVQVLDLSKDEYVAMINNIQRLSDNTFIVPFMTLKGNDNRDDHIRWVTVTIN